MAVNPSRAQALPVKHLLLDLDGTLLGSRQRMHLAFVFHSMRYFAARGIGPVKALRALRRLRTGIEARGSAATAAPNSQRAAQRLAELLGLETAAAHRLALEMTRDVFPRLESCFFPIAGARDFVEWSASRYSLALATNPVWPREIVLLRLKWAGIDPGRFRFIANGDEMCFCKPSPRYYDELIARLSVDRREALMIGDSVRKDLPARQAGIPVFLLSRGGRPAPVADGVWKGDFTALRSLLTDTLDRSHE